MQFLIYCMNVDQPEVKAIEAFCKWQMKSCKAVKSVGVCLTKSRGSGTPVISLLGGEEEDFIAEGFFEFLAWNRRNGSIVC